MKSLSRVFKFIKRNKLLKSQKGFSLVELMVVVAIIGILAAIAIPNYQKFQRKSQQVEAKTMMSGLYASQITFINEWNYLSASFAQIGFEIIGDVPKYSVGWANASKSDDSIPVAADRADGYRGPSIAGASTVETVNTNEPKGCRDKTYCNDTALVEAFSYNESFSADSNANQCPAASECSCSSGSVVNGCTTTGKACTGTCGFMTNGKLDKEAREFVIGAAGDIGGDASDQWYMDYNKIIQNVQSGL